MVDEHSEGCKCPEGGEYAEVEKHGLDVLLAVFIEHHPHLVIDWRESLAVVENFFHFEI